MKHRRGLVVGKFCPLHRGHEHVINRALQDCDDVLVLSYTKPEFPRCGPARREHWLAERCPRARRLVLDDARLDALCRERAVAPRRLPANDDPGTDHHAFIGWLLATVLRTDVDAVFTSESYGDAFAAALSRHFGPADPARAGVVHVCVDRQRTATPVSGSAIRANLQGHRAFIDPLVHADLVPRVALLGGESSGKTALAQALAQALRTCWAPEYGRELWEQRRGELAYGDMLAIATAQVARERHLAPDANGWLVCDTTPLTTAFYSEEMFGGVAPGLQALADRPYDHLVLCAPDFPFVQDGTRRGAPFRDRQHRWYLAELARRGLAFQLACGPLARRVTDVRATLQASPHPTTAEREPWISN